MHCFYELFGVVGVVIGFYLDLFWLFGFVAIVSELPQKLFFDLKVCKGCPEMKAVLHSTHLDADEKVLVVAWMHLLYNELFVAIQYVVISLHGIKEIGLELLQSIEPKYVELGGNLFFPSEVGKCVFCCVSFHNIQFCFEVYFYVAALKNFQGHALFFHLLVEQV